MNGSANDPEPEEGMLRVWWIPQVPMNAFRVPVRNIREAQLLTNALTYYDIFQLENNVKPDYCNSGGLEIFHDGEWEEWEDDLGNDIDSTEPQ